MGLKDMMGRLLNTRKDAVSSGAANNSESSLNDFEDYNYERIQRTPKNARWAYENDSTVNSVVNNAVITANHGLRIITDSPEYEEARQHIISRIDDWNLEEFITEMLLKSIIDGISPIQKSIIDGKINISFLAYDGDKFDFKVIRDPITEEVLGYKQKATVSVLDGAWEGVEFDDLSSEEEEITFDFAPGEIINVCYLQRDGEGRSGIYAALDLVDMKKRIELYMLKSAHKSGTILGIEIGADDYDLSGVSDDDIDQILEFFSEHDNKEVVGYPAGIKPNLISQKVLLDYTLYLKYLKSEIRSVLLTPDSKFESSKGSRYTAKEQMSGSAGFIVYVKYLRNFVKSYLDAELINEELELANYSDAIGHIHIDWPELEQEDAVDSSKVAERLNSIDPEADKELIKKAYFKRYAELESEMEVANLNYEPNLKEAGNTKKDDGRLKNTKRENPVIVELRKRGWKGLKGGLV